MSRIVCWWPPARQMSAIEHAIRRAGNRALAIDVFGAVRRRNSLWGKRINDFFEAWIAA